MKKSTSNRIFIFIVVLHTATSVFAGTKISSQSGNWSDASTWGGNPAPVAGDDVIINGGFGITVDISNATSLSLQLGGSTQGAGTGAISFSASGQLTVFGLVNIGPVNKNNTEGSLSMALGGKLICEGIIVGRLGTWNTGAGSIELTSTNTIPLDNNVSFNNLIISGGITTVSRNLNINSNLLINPAATLDGGSNILFVSGGWINNGTFTGHTGTVSFIKNGNQTIAGNGLNNFNLIRVNLGTNINNTLEVLSTNFSAPNSFLTITNGTFKLSGTFKFENTFFAGPIYNIDPTAGLWINNPNATVTAQAGGISVRGLLRLTAGKYDIGTDIDNSLNYVSGSSIIVEGGILNIAGRLTRNNATATTSYTQSSGTVVVVGQGSTDPIFAGFDLGAVGSTFTMSGGTIAIRNATSAPIDFLNASSVANVTGGTLQIGDTATANAQTFRIQSARPIGNLLVSNATTGVVKPTIQLIASSLNIVGNVETQLGTTLDANGFNITLGGDWLDNGSFTTGGNTVTFNGPGTQTISKPGIEIFNNLILNKPGTILNLNSSVTVNNIFNIAQGTIALDNKTLRLNGTVTGAGSFTSAITGTVNYNQAADGQNVLTGNYGNLIFSNFNKIIPSTGIIGIAGTFNPGTASQHTITGSTIDFNGGNQPIPPFTYYHLTASGSGIKSGSETITVEGNLLNNTGIIFTGTNMLNLNGTVHLNNGTLNAATLSVGSVSLLTNNGTISVGTALNGAGTLKQQAAGILNIGGIADIAILDASAVS
ncbi:MAG: hypothetical protein ABI707_11170, partial [Ferruginibacter sp.]